MALQALLPESERKPFNEAKLSEDDFVEKVTLSEVDLESFGKYGRGGAGAYDSDDEGHGHGGGNVQCAQQ